jgi:hypothetical protein
MTTGGTYSNTTTQEFIYHNLKPLFMKRNKPAKFHPSDFLTSLMYTIAFIGAICFLMSCSTPHMANNRIIKENTDKRGLTCVMYVTPSNDTFALDYLTRKEYKRFAATATQRMPAYSITCSNDTIFYK